MNNTIASAIAATTLALSAPAFADTIDAVEMISTFGTVSLGDMFIQSHTEAPIYVGGNLSGSTSFDGVGQGVVGSLSGEAVIAGDISANVTTNGSTVLAGSVSGSVNGGGTTVTTGIDVPVADVSAAFFALSAELASLSVTTGAMFDVTDPNVGTLVSGAGDNGLAVLNITGDALSGGNLANYTRDPDVTFIVNVSGAAISLDFTVNQDDSNVIFNFFEATSLSVNRTFGFGVLAPYADVTLASGGTDTFVVGGTIDQRTEVRGVFTGTIPLTPPSAVPLPAGLVLLLGGLGGLTALRSRRS